MNIEENRLQTFNFWPSDAPVSPARVAKAGFYSVNQDLIVQCFCCGLQISEWSYGDQVMTRHRELRPECEFVLNPTTSGNVPNISQVVHSNEQNVISPDMTDSANHDDMVVEGARLETFDDWPVPDIVSPESLARAGFYYLKHRDKTKCAFCNGVVVAWEPGDDPDEEHKRHFPECSFVQFVINPRLQNSETSAVIESSLTNLSIVSQNNLEELGVNAHSAPKKSRYATLESRMGTFATWPVDLIQTPEALGQAGFYYEGAGDQVRCFHCDGGLRHWDPHDDPWTEHAKWFPKCQYVTLVKGQDFVNACKSNATESESQDPKASARPFQRREITDREVQSHMTTPQAISAFNIGIHASRVKKAIVQKLEQTGTGFATVDALIEAALGLQHDEEETTDPNISNEVKWFLSNAVRLTSVTSAPNSSLTVAHASESKPAAVDTPSVSGIRQLEVGVSLEEENRLLREARLCKICMDIEVGIVFLPCGHLATCVKCASNLQDCPVCRSAIKATVRTFLS